MLNLSSTSDVLRVVTVSAADIEVHASWVDLSGTTVTPDGLNTPNITTATTTTVVPAPGSGVVRNVKGLYITNVHASASTRVVVEVFDGTTVAELMGVTLKTGENLTFNEEGRWSHRDAQGAEYPPAGLGSYGGYTLSWYKNGTPPEATGTWYCSSKDGGYPGAWSPGTPGINGRTTDGTTAADGGCVPVRNPSTGANYITYLDMVTNQAAHNVFFDVLWVNTGLSVTTTTAQNITQPTLPARDANGTSDGEGCEIALLFTAAATNAGAISNATVSYTNSAGTAGRTATLSALVGSQIPATPVIGVLVWFNLAAGDKGVRSIQSITLGTSLVTGSVSLMVVRRVATVGTFSTSVPATKAISGAGIRLYNGTCLLHAAVASSTTSVTYVGELTIAEK